MSFFLCNFSNLLIYRMKITLSEGGSESWKNGAFYGRPYSMLKMYGYSVGKNGLDQRSRQHIISFLIDNGIMLKHEIISLLQGNIRLREDSYTDYSIAIGE